ncbi:MAG TPA: LytTR family DNA-binding domain-containing protein [Bacteroidales bacterium]|nr:LytTR family DNA-binding domain-containing protein [Bacteroidales bacterium]
MKIRCLAVDDEPLALEQIAAYIKRTPFLELNATCRSGYEAIEALSSQKADLMFADINMPDLNGLDFVKSLRIKPLVIFTTAFSEYAIEGFRVEALDYLLKPISYSDFLKSANRALAILEAESKAPVQDTEGEESLFVKIDYRIVRIAVRDIIFIEGMREYVRIHLANRKPVMSLIRMHSLETQLPASKFMRVHRSYIVNLEKISAYEHSRIVFDGNVYVPVSEQYKEHFTAYLSSRILGGATSA